MKQLFIYFTILIILFNINSSTLAMSPQQEEFYKAAIVELDVYKALELLQRNNIDLNEPIEANGRQTTFLHELLQVATEFYSSRADTSQDTVDNLYNDSSSLLFDPIDQMQNNVFIDLGYSIYQLLRLFLGFGANVDLVSNYFGMSAREVARNFQTSQGNNPLTFVANFPTIANENYREYRDRTRNNVVTAIRNRNFGSTVLISIFGVFLYIIFYYFI